MTSWAWAQLTKDDQIVPKVVLYRQLQAEDDQLESADSRGSSCEYRVQSCKAGLHVQNGHDGRSLVAAAARHLAALDGENEEEVVVARRNEPMLACMECKQAWFHARN